MDRADLPIGAACLPAAPTTVTEAAKAAAGGAAIRVGEGCLETMTGAPPASVITPDGRPDTQGPIVPNTAAADSPISLLHLSRLVSSPRCLWQVGRAREQHGEQVLSGTVYCPIPLRGLSSS